MAPREAMVLIADEIFYNLHGKAVLQGIYHTDLTIPREESLAPQLIFFFMIETDLSEPFQNLGVEVTLPGSEPVRNFVFVPPPQVIAQLAKTQPERQRWHINHPLLIPAPILRSGRIQAKVMHDGNEMLVTAPWIQSNVQVAPARSN